MKVETAQPIDELLTFHDVTGSSPDSIRAYAHHLKLYWKYLTEAQLNWRAATLQDVGQLCRLASLGPAAR